MRINYLHGGGHDQYVLNRFTEMEYNARFKNGASNFNNFNPNQNNPNFNGNGIFFNLNFVCFNVLLEQYLVNVYFLHSKTFTFISFFVNTFQPLLYLNFILFKYAFFFHLVFYEIIPWIKIR
jgi:hypothetical protein